jgi:hypothetical protein
MRQRRRPQDDDARRIVRKLSKVKDLRLKMAARIQRRVPVVSSSAHSLKAVPQKPAPRGVAIKAGHGVPCPYELFFVILVCLCSSAFICGDFATDRACDAS